MICFIKYYTQYNLNTNFESIPIDVQCFFLCYSTLTTDAFSKLSRNQISVRIPVQMEQYELVYRMFLSGRSLAFSSWKITLIYHFLRRLLDAGLPEDTVFVKLKGSAGMLVVTVCSVCEYVHFIQVALIMTPYRLNWWKTLYRISLFLSSECSIYSVWNYIDRADLYSFYLKKVPITACLIQEGLSRATWWFLLYEIGSCCGNVLEVKTTVCGIINIFALIKCVRIVINFIWTLGQSFGAFICRGITLELEGDANDYVGKVYWWYLVRSEV
jgi:hypothetical protein